MKIYMPIKVHISVMGYNCEMGACITNNHICIDDISIISKSKKEDDNVSV